MNEILGSQPMEEEGDDGPRRWQWRGNVRTWWGPALSVLPEREVCICCVSREPFIPPIYRSRAQQITIKISITLLAPGSKHCYLPYISQHGNHVVASVNYGRQYHRPCIFAGCRVCSLPYMLIMEDNTIDHAYVLVAVYARCHICSIRGAGRC
jgi:hypothetical protein